MDRIISELCYKGRVFNKKKIARGQTPGLGSHILSFCIDFNAS